MKKEYSYRIQGWSLLLGSVAMVLFFIMCVVPPFINKTAGITTLDIIQDKNNLFSFVIAFLTTIGFALIIIRYILTKKNNHKFVITDIGIVFPPKAHLKEILTIPYNQIKSIEKVSGRGSFAVNINTEVGDFSFPEMNFETKDMILEVYDLIKGYI